MDRLGLHLQDRQGHQRHCPKIVVLSRLPHEAYAFVISLDEAYFHQFLPLNYFLNGVFPFGILLLLLLRYHRPWSLLRRYRDQALHRLPHRHLHRHLHRPLHLPRRRWQQGRRQDLLIDLRVRQER